VFSLNILVKNISIPAGTVTLVFKTKAPVELLKETTITPVGIFAPVTIVPGGIIPLVAVIVSVLLLVADNIT